MPNNNRSRKSTFSTSLQLSLGPTNLSKSLCSTLLRFHEGRLLSEGCYSHRASEDICKPKRPWQDEQECWYASFLRSHSDFSFWAGLSAKGKYHIHAHTHTIHTICAHFLTVELTIWSTCGLYFLPWRTVLLSQTFPLRLSCVASSSMHCCSTPGNELFSLSRWFPC